MRKEEKSHIIKEEKAEIGGRAAHLMQEFKAQKFHGGERDQSSITQYPQRRSWRH